MKAFLDAARLLLVDLASTLFFLALFLLTHNTVLSVGLGMGLGIAQIGRQVLRRSQIHTMEWLSLFLVIAAGSATLLTNDLRFVLFKPSVIYLIAGAVMLKRGWFDRYLPDIARKVAPDVAAIIGFVWAGVMFLSAVLNAVIALGFSVSTWAMIMPLYGIVSKVAVFLGGFVALRLTVRRRLRAMPVGERDALLAAFGPPGQSASSLSPARSTPR